ncbi:GNAT family N-acetyltransferase [Burkholderia glumae]|uniref:GNAT family N-acetyltransferase n=1 Tax=Burkholderia glumae TaxID=337 RepID=UPI00214F74FC|nr:GNAT family N-acetyltransferase [Burkholderia glumae]
MSAPPVQKAPAFRAFEAADLGAAHALSLAAGWPHRAEDWQWMFAAGGGFVALDEGVVIGTALYWKYGSDRATLGLVIVSAEAQGRGIGRQLTERVLGALGKRVTFLHATPAGKPLYEKLDFKVCGTLDQHQGTVNRVARVEPPSAERLRALSCDDVPRVIELASRASGLDRSEIIPMLLDVAQGVVLERDGELLGFSLARGFGRGYAIGPVVAARSPDDARAKALISHWLAIYSGEFVRIDVPGEAGLGAWLDALGLKRVDTVVKMVRNAPAEPHRGAPDARYGVFGILNQAMG